jgi:hypothetical protein
MFKYNFNYTFYSLTHFFVNFKTNISFFRLDQYTGQVRIILQAGSIESADLHLKNPK